MERIRRVAKPRPHMMAVAKGAQKTDLPPTPKAMGANPHIVVIEVRMMGRIRTWQPRTRAK